MPNTDSKPTFDNEQKQTPQTSQYVSQYHRQIEDDTIDLYGLWIILWDKKWLVIALTVISALGSAVYALLQPEIYIAEALLLPPKAKDVQSLNQLQEIEGLQQVLDSNFVFSAFKYNLSSRSLQKKFIEKQGLMDILAPNRTPETRDIEILQRFSEMIKTEKQKIGDGISVIMVTETPDFAAKLVNDYIDFFDIETIRELSADARNTIDGRIRKIEQTIDSKKQMERLRREDEIREIEISIFSKRETEKKFREDEIKELEETISLKRNTAKIKREDKIKLYEEASVIATNLGFRDRIETTNINNIVQNTQIAENQNISSTPLYYRGFRALNAEIEFLKNRKTDDPYIPKLRQLQEKLDLLRSRKSDDPFIFGLRDLQVKVDQLRSKKLDYTFFPGLRGLQEELTLLRSVKFDEKDQHSVTIDQPAYPPKYRIKPNRRLITLVGTSAGLIFGILLVLTISFILKQKEIHSA